MRVQSFTRYAAFAVLVGALACARNPEPDSDEAAAARDTARDTLGGDVQNPPGYRGMERDTTQVPEGQPADTFLQEQGTGTPTDTAGYAGMERPPAGAAQTDTTGFGTDTTGYGGNTTGAGIPDTTGAWRDTSGVSGMDTTGTLPTDTTGYNPSQELQDTTSR
jgi:hypothetical protein